MIFSRVDRSTSARHRVIKLNHGRWNKKPLVFGAFSKLWLSRGASYSTAPSSQYLAVQKWDLNVETTHSRKRIPESRIWGSEVIASARPGA